jgi:hypothetical protein
MRNTKEPHGKKTSQPITLKKLVLPNRDSRSLSIVHKWKSPYIQFDGFHQANDWSNLDDKINKRINKSKGNFLFNSFSFKY